jgi:alkylated DNA repair dioxygenase AlkB
MNAPTRRVRPASPSSQTDLFAASSGLLEGFRYYADVLSVDEVAALAHELGTLPFKPFNFQGFLANRQVVSFGYRYDYDRRAVVEAAPFPSFLIPLRRKVAAIFDRPEETFRQVLINEYRPGAGIGWHRDKAQFDEVVGVSLLAPCTLRFRRKTGQTWAARRSRPSRARLICFRGPRARSGSTAFPLSTGFAIRSPCGRWLLLTKSAHSPPRSE